MDLPPVPYLKVSAHVLCIVEVGWKYSYVTAGEVTTLEHELGNDTVERRALVSEALLASAESLEVLGGLGDNVIKEVEVDATLLSCKKDDG